MTSRALVVGASGATLTGVTHDLDTITGLLTARGFTITRLEDGAATRAGILAAYRDLITASAVDDAAVFFYAGHGGVVAQAATAGQASSMAAVYQFICPSDIDDSGDGDFRGITALELAALQTELTDRTTNVTTILDCCHAAHMSRDLDMVPRARAHTDYADIAAHHAHLDAGLLERAARAPGGNQSAVRLVACGADQVALEYTDTDGQRGGLFTQSLKTVLATAGDLPVTWGLVVEQVRRRVQVLAPGQRPEAEGPSRRLLFRRPLRTVPSPSRRCPPRGRRR